MKRKMLTLPLRVGLAFAALAVGFLGTVVSVPLALQPLAARAEAIQHDLAASVRALSDLRANGRDLRGEALLAYQAQWDRSLDREARARAVSALRAELSRLADEYAALPRTGEEDAIWQDTLRSVLPALDEAVARTLAARGRPEGDPGAIQHLVATGATIDERLRRLVEINVEETQAESARLHSSMRLLSVVYVALAGIGAVGAALLVLQVVGLLRRHGEEVARRMAELEAFAGQVSHDLRSPLQTVHLAVGAIEKKAEDASSVRRLAGRANGAIQRLDGMIRDLLQFARSGARARDGERSDVPAIVGELARELAPLAERAAVALTTRSDPALAARIAPVALRTVLANLVENAIKYRRGAGDDRVEVTAVRDGSRIRVTVKDAGVGIPPSALPRLFEPFFRATKRPDSYGLGLATVKRLVESHGGTILVQSEEGRGTTFIVTLRRADAGSARPEPLESGGEAHASMPS
jgi:signal transduction histidine kinase